jgi:hypothetical protein
VGELLFGDADESPQAVSARLTSSSALSIGNQRFTFVQRRGIGTPEMTQGNTPGPIAAHAI